MNKLFFIFLFFFIGCAADNFQSDKIRKSEVSKNPKIISLAPSITETICALGAADKIYGITEFCVYPPEIVSTKKIGGFTNLNYEMIAAIKPDSAFMLPIHSKEFDKLKQMNIDCRLFPLNNVADIKNSINEMGLLLDRKDSAAELISELEKSISYQPINKLKDKKVLIIVSRATDALNSIFAAGTLTFYSDILQYLGLKNALPSGNIDYPMINSESVAAANPDIIIEIYAPDAGMTSGRTVADLKKDWKKFKNISAVKNGNIFYIIKDYAVVPGPRIINLIEDIKSILKEYAEN